VEEVAQEMFHWRGFVASVMNCWFRGDRVFLGEILFSHGGECEDYYSGIFRRVVL
jgi:hypothetical protein